jgi:heme A synthase
MCNPFVAPSELSAEFQRCLDVIGSNPHWPQHLALGGGTVATVLLLVLGFVWLLRRAAR